MQNTGHFVVIEGMDGSGKSTITARLTEQLKQELGEDMVLATREIGGTAFAEQIRAAVSNKEFALCNKAAILAVMAARMDHLEKVIYPAVAAGKVVVCDRFFYSTMVYQGELDGGTAALAALGNCIAFDGLFQDPDRVVYLAGNPLTLHHRAVERKRVDFPNYKSDPQTAIRIEAAYREQMAALNARIEKGTTNTVLNIVGTEGRLEETLEVVDVIAHDIASLFGK